MNGSASTEPDAGWSRSSGPREDFHGFTTKHDASESYRAEGEFGSQVE